MQIPLNHYGLDCYPHFCLSLFGDNGVCVFHASTLVGAFFNLGENYMKKFTKILIILILLLIPTSCSNEHITKENFSEYFIINQKVINMFQEKIKIDSFTTQYVTTCNLSIEIIPKNKIKVNKNAKIYLSVYPAKWFTATPLNYFKLDDDGNKSEFIDKDDFIHYIIHSEFNKDGTIKLVIPCKTIQTKQNFEKNFSDTDWLPSAEIYDVIYN